MYFQLWQAGQEESHKASSSTFRFGVLGAVSEHLVAYACRTLTSVLTDDVALGMGSGCERLSSKGYIEQNHRCRTRNLDYLVLLSTTPLVELSLCIRAIWLSLMKG